MSKRPTRHYRRGDSDWTACGESVLMVKVAIKNKSLVTCYTCKKKLKRWAFNKRIRKLIRSELLRRGLE
jgi:hypothetical protein